MKSSLLKNDYNTSWKHKIEPPVSGRTQLRMMGACLLGDSSAPKTQISLDQSLIGYAVVFFSLGYLLNL